MKKCTVPPVNVSSSSADDVNREHCYETVQLSDGNLNLVAYWIENSGENYWYKDEVYNGKRYRGLFVVRSRDNSYRQEQAGYVPLYLYIGRNHSKKDQVKIHWFNYDPIKRSVVDEGNGKAFLVCRTKLETMKFGHDKWEQSPIREYLNKTIYNVIFNDEQKAIVLKSTVANDIESMGGYGVGHEDFATYATDDYFFLLSYAELNLYKNKFVSGAGASSYCVATLSKGDIWTRSHCRFQQNSDSRILAFNGSDEIAGVNPEYNDRGHVLPAMRITL